MTTRNAAKLAAANAARPADEPEQITIHAQAAETALDALGFQREHVQIKLGERAHDAQHADTHDGRMWARDMHAALSERHHQISDAMEAIEAATLAK